MNKHRLMLSAAAAALLAACAASATLSAARADTEVSTSTGTALTTTSGGNITIDATGSVNTASTTPTISINSNNSVLNSGTISNDGTTGAVGVEIDTTAASILPPSTGLSSTGIINLQGNGTDKTGILITGGNTYFGPITLTSITDITTAGTYTTSSSQLGIKGDTSAAMVLTQGTKVDSNIYIAGSVIQTPSDNSTASGSTVIFLDGTVNGNFINAASIQGIGNGIRGIASLGGIHSCISDQANNTFPTGFTCPSSSSGAFINAGTVQLAGIAIPATKGVNLESGSAVVIGGSIDGGFVNEGPATSSNLTAGVLAASGLTIAPTVLIDPGQSITATQLTVRGPIVIGQIATDVDAVDPGYSFLNRGTISASPIDAQVSAAAMVIQGASPSATTTLTGGLLNTGSITAQARTTQQTVTPSPPSGLSANVVATALAIGSYATIPNIDVRAETISSGSNTPGTIAASVTGIGQGSAFGLIINENANVAAINVGKNASILASVTTSTVAPTVDIAPQATPFVVSSTAIEDLSSTLGTINNAGTIQAVTTQFTPATNAFVASAEIAINLSQSTRSNIQINNSGVILGNVLFGSAGSGDTLNVGNIGTNGAANSATGVVNTSSNYAIVAGSVISQVANQAPVTTANTIDFGSGANQTLHVGTFGYVDSIILASQNHTLDVLVDNGGTLFVANTTKPATCYFGCQNSPSLYADDFTVTGATLGLTISQNTTGVTPVVSANTANISNANLGLQFGSFVSSGNTVASTATPSPQVITLISAGSLTDTTIAQQNAQLAQDVPFLFESPNETGYNSTHQLDNGGALLVQGTANGNQTLLLRLIPRATGATNADGTAGLNLSGDARNEFPFAAAALSNDSQLGSALASSLTVYNTAGTPSSGINIAASQQAAERAFSQFAPDVSGGARAVAVMLTDQASGPVAARQSLLRSYADQPGEMTLWAEEFTGQINNKGRVDGEGSLTAYKDHGFGFTLGIDSGSPRKGWYGGAFTFYTGDLSETLPRASKTDTQWYMLTGYTDWHGRHLFLDTQGSVAYGDFLGNRSIDVGSIDRTAEGKRAGLMGALGANTGVIMKYAGFEIDPHVSLDGLVLREEGYTESGGGDGFNLQVAPYYANSFRTAVGADFKTGLNIWGVELSPEAQLAYRYDLISDAVKLKAAFVSTGGLSTVNNQMTFVGPDPDSGNAIMGLGLGASTDTWQLGAKYNWIRGNNGSTTQVGIFTLLGRI